MAEAAARKATWDDLLDVPEGYIGEIVAGEVRVHRRPGAPHSETTSDLGGVLTPPFRFGRGGPGGWVIACEVLSRRTAIRDGTEKLPLYARCGVAYLWLVDPDGFTVEAYRREAEGYLLMLSAQGQTTLRIPPFEAIEFDLSLLWGDRFDPNAIEPRED